MRDMESHARFLIEEYDKRERTPRVSAVHMAKEPRVCSDCGRTFWDVVGGRGSHVGCVRGKGAGY